MSIWVLVKRTEIKLLKQHAHEMAELLGTDSYLLELGSGSSIKIRLLLEAVRPKIYVPMDISREHLIQSSLHIPRDYPWLTVHAAYIDYSQSWKKQESEHLYVNASYASLNIIPC